MLHGGATIAAMAAFAGLVPAYGQQASPAPNAISPDAALARLQEGNARYAANTSTNKDFSAGRAARAQGQYPIAGILSCADSRVSPELLYDQGPGELFVCRVAGNFVTDDGLASLEYGVKVLGVPLLVVLGHSACGAVDATIKVIQQGTQLPGHLPQLVDALKPGVQAAIAQKPENLLAAATIENVRYNVKRLATAQPVVAPLVESGKVKVIGGVYDIATGKVNPVS
jgi:carbonic anhydrase